MDETFYCGICGKSWNDCVCVKKKDAEAARNYRKVTCGWCGTEILFNANTEYEVTCAGCHRTMLVYLTLYPKKSIDLETSRK